MIFMAIQLPDVGTGVPADQTGDSPWLAMKKVRENFNDQTNAASKLVGTAAGNVMEVGSFGLGRTTSTPPMAEEVKIHDLPLGFFRYKDFSENTPTKMLPYGSYGMVVKRHVSTCGAALFLPYHTGSNEICIRNFNSTSYKDFYFWTDRNTKLDTNGSLSPSSPTIDLYSDHIKTNEDAARMNPEFVRNGVGDYTIKNTTGLRDEGWYIKIPNDMNGNPKVAVAIDTDKDGSLSIKTYRRIFNMETFIFEPDLEQPLDIPDGRWIDLRLNEIPFEAQEELPTDGG